MSLVKNYRTFRDNLQGYCDISVVEFRDHIYPLRKKHKWTEEETQFVRDLVDIGAGPALSRLFGAHHGPAKGVLGSELLPLASLPKQSLEEYMRGFMKSCLAASWTFDDYTTFQAYLDSDLTPAALDEALRKQERSSTSTVMEAAKEDAFAKMYRKGDAAFKRVIQGYLAGAALSAR